MKHLLISILLPLWSFSQGIQNPERLSFEFIELRTLEDGTQVNAFKERGKTSKDGDYIWTKMKPLYASDEIEFAYEYQMDLTLRDVQNIQKFMDQNFDTEFLQRPFQNKSWYKENMPLNDIYSQVITRKVNFTIVYYSRETKDMLSVIFDAGSSYSSSEIGFVWTRFKD